VWPRAKGKISGNFVGKPAGEGGVYGEKAGKIQNAYTIQHHLLGFGFDNTCRLTKTGLTPPPDACQFTEIYLPPAATTSVSHALPLILTFS
jgi:hypothetical protein